MEAAALRELTAHIVSGYVSKNPLQRADLPKVVGDIAAALARLVAPTEPEHPKLVAPISINKSITPDYLVSLEDGKRYKSLKRHLGIRGLTPEEYREKWGLPRDYPMVAPNYSKARSQLAKSMGLGHKPGAKPKPTRKAT